MKFLSSQGRAARPLLTASLLAALLAGVARGATAAPPPEHCEKVPAEKAFSAGMERYGRRLWDEAIPKIEDAAALCPAPKNPWDVSIAIFGLYPFLPYYYLGKCHFNLKDLPAALRQFYLSSCAGEPARDNYKTTVDLSSLTQQCRRELASKQPQFHPYFPAGLDAAQQKNWEKAAEKMWDSLQVWEEDGRTTLPSGRWPEPYLPRFRLAEALFQLGCHHEACEQLDQSLLKKLNTPEVAQDRRRLEKLKPECERRKNEPENESCQRWQCWLQKRGL
jgi:hypothetical protein